MWEEKYKVKSTIQASLKAEDNLELVYKYCVVCINED